MQGTICKNPNFQLVQLQPAIMSRQAIIELAPSILYGYMVVRQCSEFNVTHDLALGILTWMRGFHYHVRNKHHSLHQEMAGGFNITLCESVEHRDCYDRGFYGRLDSVRYTPQKITLHGVKHPDQFGAVWNMYSNPDVMRIVRGVVFTEDQLPEIRAVNGYEHTQHYKDHPNWQLNNLTREEMLSLWSNEALRKERWPVIGHSSCNPNEYHPPTDWDRYMVSKGHRRAVVLEDTWRPQPEVSSVSSNTSHRIRRRRRVI